MHKILILQAQNQMLNMNLAKAIKTRLWTLDRNLELSLRRLFQNLDFPSCKSLGVRELHVEGSLRTLILGKPLGTHST